MEEDLQRVEEAIEAIRAGEMVILVDDEDRENEGDLCFAAEKVTPEAINFMAMHGRGLICMTMTGERLDQLEIPMMVDRTSNDSQFGTAFTVSIEAREGISTGISAADRARTVEVAVAEDAKPSDLVTPGHIFPLRAQDGGVLVRTGQTEGSVDLARMAGLEPAGVICEIMKEDGTMARMPDLEEFSREHGVPIVSVADLINYRLRRESLVEIIEDSELPTDYEGQWRVKVVKSLLDGSEHFAFVCGDPTPDQPTLVRVQHRCDTIGVFMHRECECITKITGSMQRIGEEGKGVIVYLDKTARSARDLLRRHGLLDASPHAEKKRTEAEINRPKQALKEVGIGAQILAAVGVGKMQLLTNRPKKVIGLDGYGLQVVEQVPIDQGSKGPGVQGSREDV
ncbi:MAG: 3,4-dihydroxy-2-butanone-4-phosphate synthase [Persicimonas sp.]